MVGSLHFSWFDNNGLAAFVVLFLGSHREQDPAEPLARFGHRAERFCFSTGCWPPLRAAVDRRRQDRVSL